MIDRDEVLRMAQECQLIGMRPHLDGIYQEAIERFAALCHAAGQRDMQERAAEVCEEKGFTNYSGIFFADNIRALEVKL